MSGQTDCPPLLERHPGDIDPLRLAASVAGFSQVHTVRGWTIALWSPLRVLRDLPELSDVAERLAWRGARDPALPPFTGGLAGWLTDDLAPRFLHLDADDPRPSPAPLEALTFGLYDTAICRSPDGQVWLTACDLPGESRSPAAERLAALRDVLARVTTLELWPERVREEARPSLDAAEHADSVARVRAWIAAGDLYQLNLTVQFRAAWPHGGEALARRLWAASPDAPHAAWLRAPGGAEIVSVSPETFLRTDGDRAVMRPIKGTRPRSDDALRDDAQARALRASAKDRAEHVMIVDLERNDLGRVAVPGTVVVRELAALEAHPTVWHLTSTVEARLRDKVGLHELLAATFPCGSVTGAPKRMAVARIREVEPLRRGVYCGALGVIGPGLVDLSVAIRTAVVHDGVAHYGAGGGIVADSDPTQEWQEVLHKAQAFFSATNTRPS